jgi:hypothetical protein
MFMNERLHAGEACIASASTDPSEKHKAQRAAQEIAAARALADRLRTAGLLQLGELIAQATADAARPRRADED